MILLNLKIILLQVQFELIEEACEFTRKTILRNLNFQMLTTN